MVEALVLGGLRNQPVSERNMLLSIHRGSVLECNKRVYPRMAAVWDFGYYFIGIGIIFLTTKTFFDLTLYLGNLN